MTRREFLVSSAAVAAAGATTLSGQAPSAAPPPPPMTAAQRQARLARISILTLNFQSVIKAPERPNATMYDIMDIPEMYADKYGVHYVEVFCTHFLELETPYFNKFKDKLKMTKSKINQISLGGLANVSMSSPSPTVRTETIDLTKRWIDHAVELECPRVMVNQGTLADDVYKDAVAALKIMSDYGKSKNVKVALEHRGGSGGDLVDAIKQASAYANLDLGNFPDEETRHREIRRMLPLTSGSTHMKLAPERWSLADSMKIAVNEMGYKGIWALEGSGTDPYETTQRMLDAILPLM